MNPRSLYKFAAKQVDRVLDSSITDVETRFITIPVGIFLGVLPMGTLFIHWSIFSKVSAASAWNWIEVILGLAATLFSLIIAVTAILIGLGLQGVDRSSVFLSYRRKGFDAVLAHGLCFFGSSGLVVLVLMVNNHMNSSIRLGMFLLTSTSSFLTLLAGIGFLTFSTISLVTKDRIGVDNDKFLEEMIYKAVRDLGIEKLSVKFLANWTKTNNILLSDMLTNDYSGHYVVYATQSGVVEDINLKVLSKWIKRLRVEPNNVIVNINLGRFVRKNDLLAIYRDGVGDAKADFLNAIRLGPGPSRRSLKTLSDELTATSDLAVSYCKVFNQSGFASVLNRFENFYRSSLTKSHTLEESFQISVTNDLTFIITWLVQLRHVGSSVLSSGSDNIINIWMNFLVRLLRVARDTTFDPSIRMIFNLWIQLAFALGERLEQLWMVLKSYELELCFELDNASDEKRIQIVTSHMVGQLPLAAQLIVNLPKINFINVRAFVDQIGNAPILEHLLVASTSSNVTEVEIVKRRALLELAFNKKRFWMMYGAWLIQTIDGEVSEEVVRQLSFIRDQFTCLEELLRVWKSFDNFEGMNWSSFFADVRSKGEPNSTIFIDPYAGTQWVFVLVGSKIAVSTPANSLPPDPMAWINFSNFIDPIAKRIESQPEKWVKVTSLDADTLLLAIDSLRNQFKSSGHRGELQRNQRIAEAPIDQKKVHNYISSLFGATHNVGLELFKNLDDLGRVIRTSQDHNEAVCLLRHTISKSAIIDTGDFLDDPYYGPSIALLEDAYIVGKALNHDLDIEVAPDDLVSTVEESINRLTERRTPATLIIAPNNGRLLQKFHKSEKFRSVTDIPGLMGVFQEVPIYYASSPYLTDDKLIILSLPFWAKLTLCLNNTTHDRFRVILRPLNEQETLRFVENTDRMQSDQDFKYSANDLKVLAQCSTVIEIYEELDVIETDSQACVVIGIRSRSE